MRIMAASVLAAEGVAVWFAGLVAKDLTDLSTPVALTLFGVLGSVCVLASGLLGRPGGYAFGSGLQVAVLASGVVVTPMAVLGLMFGALWVTALVAGRRLKRLQSGE